MSGTEGTRDAVDGRGARKRGTEPAADEAGNAEKGDGVAGTGAEGHGTGDTGGSGTAARQDAPGGTGTVVLSAMPRIAPLYAKAVLRRGSGAGPAELPATRLVLPGVDVDRAHVAAYAEVCGFPRTGCLPPTYPHLLAFPLSLALMTAPGFPLPLLGLVHVANRVVLHRPLDPAERLTVAVHAEGPVPHAKGTAFDVVARVEAARAGVPVWESRSTYLRREAGRGGAAGRVGRADGAGRGGGAAHEGATGHGSGIGHGSGAGQDSGTGRDGAAASGSRAADGAPPTAATALWRVPAGTGRAYAAVSGDRNPIHLHPWAARPFGYRRAIAHGMWTAARALAALGPRLPGAAVVDVAFHRPLLLPGTARFAMDPPLGGGPADEGAFTVVDARSGRPHLTGSFRAR